MINVKLTEKEEKAIATVVAFLQGLKDCKKEDEETYLLDNALACRTILSFGKSDSKNTHTILSSHLILNMIPYLVAKKNESIDKVAEDFDDKTDKMMEDLVKKHNEMVSEMEKKESKKTDGED